MWNRERSEKDHISLYAYLIIAQKVNIKKSGKLKIQKCPDKIGMDT